MNDEILGAIAGVEWTTNCNRLLYGDESRDFGLCVWLKERMSPEEYAAFIADLLMVEDDAYPQ